MIELICIVWKHSYNQLASKYLSVCDNVSRRQQRKDIGWGSRTQDREEMEHDVAVVRYE